MPATCKTTKQNKITYSAAPKLGRPDTPPDSPSAQLSNPLDFARQVIDTVKLIQTCELKDASSSTKPQLDPDVKHAEPIIRASKLEVKEVHEV